MNVKYLIGAIVWVVIFAILMLLQSGCAHAPEPVTEDEEVIQLFNGFNHQEAKNEAAVLPADQPVQKR